MLLIIAMDQYELIQINELLETLTNQKVRNAKNELYEAIEPGNIPSNGSPDYIVNNDHSAELAKMKNHIHLKEIKIAEIIIYRLEKLGYIIVINDHDYEKGKLTFSLTIEKYSPKYERKVGLIIHPQLTGEIVNLYIDPEQNECESFVQDHFLLEDVMKGDLGIQALYKSFDKFETALMQMYFKLYNK